MNRRFQHYSRNTGFTVVELLVVIAISAILISLVVPSLSRLIKGSQSTQTLSHLRIWGQALHLYTGENDGTMPGPTFVNVDRWLNRSRMGMAANPTQMTTLFAYLYPYVNPDWATTVMAGPAEYFPKEAQCPVTASAGPQNPMQHFIRTVGAKGQPDPFGYLRTDTGLSTSPMKLVNLAGAHGLPQSQIPMLSTLDKQNSRVGSSDGLSPEKAAHNGRRAYLFFDGHTELIPVPPTAKYGDQVVPGYRN
jgi:prepilin-type N-terminal cleavage/methylation domain-containing protein/prepilin-type processing-associated H-X9-DG protein